MAKVIIYFLMKLFGIVIGTVIYVHSFFEFFFFLKIPLTRRVEYVMDGSTDQ